LLAVVLAASPTFAATFSVTGLTDVTGTLTIDTVAGTVTVADLDYSVTSPPDYTNIVSQFQNASVGYLVRVADGSTGTVDLLTIVLDDNGTSLVGYEGGAIVLAHFLSGCTAIASVFQCSGVSADLGTGALTATPLPAALPLFATGIGGLGLLGWRRKRKVQAVA
jgi:hypothetical protein